MGGFLDAENGIEFLASARAGAYLNGPGGEQMREAARQRHIAEGKLDANGNRIERRSEETVAELRAETAAVPAVFQAASEFADKVAAVSKPHIPLVARANVHADDKPLLPITARSLPATGCFKV